MTERASGPKSGTQAGVAARVRAGVEQTIGACRFALSRRDGSLVALVTGTGYLLLYLWLSDLLTIRADAGVGWLLVDQPLARLLERRGPLSFEPVALLEFGYGTVLVAPVDATIGSGLAALVGLNLALSYLAVVQPRACGIGAGTGVAASVPALLSGTACCAPAIIIVLGIQASATVLTVLPWLLPIGAGLLLASLGYVAGRIDAGRDAEPATAA